MILSRNLSLTERFSYTQEIFNQVKDNEAILKYENLTNTLCSDEDIPNDHQSKKISE